jgi:DNA/RNA endonuclease YhcR with UshA esterase domain
MSITRLRRLTALFAVSLLGVSSAFWGQDKKLTTREAKYRIGEQATVCGRVASGRHRRAPGNPTFLDLDKAYPNQTFTVLIWGKDRAKFRNPEETYRNKKICVTGRVGSDRGEPEMIISDPSQLSRATGKG